MSLFLNPSLPPNPSTFSLTLSNPIVSINYYGVALGFIFCFILPFAASLFLVKKYKWSFILIILGASSFYVAVYLAENLFVYLLKVIYTLLIGSLSKLFYICVIGLCPGIFEESARFVAMKFIAKRCVSQKEYKNRKTCLAYGLGHGGFECVIGVGLNFLIILVNSNSLIEQGSLYSDITFVGCLISIWERIFAVLFHISASILVFKSIKENTYIFYIIAIFYHDFIDEFAMFYQLGVIKSIYSTELLISFFFLNICNWSILFTFPYE